MSPNLYPASRGHLNAAESETLFQEAWATENGPALVYSAASTRVWMMVAHRHTANELREWHGLLRTLRHWARRSGDEAFGERFQTLADQVSFSISMEDRVPLSELVRRSSERLALEALASAPDGAMSRKEIEVAINRRQGNVSLIVNLLTLAGAVEATGFEDPVRITEIGRAALPVEPDIKGP